MPIFGVVLFSLLQKRVVKDGENVTANNSIVYVCVCTSHKPIGPQPHLVIYVVANAVRGLLDREIPEEHLQSSNRA